MRARSPAARLALLALSPLSAQTVDEPEVLWRDVRSKKEGIDLVFLPDGFGVDELEDFEKSVRKAIHSLERQEASFVRADRKAWNMHVGFVPSDEVCPSAPGTPARSAFRTYVTLPEEGGLYESDEARLLGAARKLSPGVDCTILVVSFDKPVPFATGNLPGEGSIVRLPIGMENVLLHELGHSLFALGDEYAHGCADTATHGGRFAEHERAVVPFYPNVTLDPSGARFEQLVGQRVKLEEGSLYHRLGVYRARGECVMSESSAARFCPVCAAVIEAGLPSDPPTSAPELEVLPPRDKDETRVALRGGIPASSVIRSVAVLLAAPEEWSDEQATARLRAADERLSKKTRYMESAWIADGSLPDERVFSFEGHVTTLSLGKLEAGDYLLLAATANLRGLSPVATARLRVP